MKKTITISLEAEIIRKIRAAATENRRTVSGQIEHFCAEQLGAAKQKGK